VTLPKVATVTVLVRRLEAMVEVKVEVK